jgi:hypothetical protein
MTALGSTTMARARAMSVVVDGRRARSGATSRRGRGAARATAVANAVACEDAFVGRATRAARGNGALATTEEAQGLRIARAPTNRIEESRFTDFSALTAAEFEGPKDGASADASGTRVEDACAVVVLVDGALDAAQSDLEGAKSAGVSISTGAGDAATGAQSAVRGNVFAAINAASATDVVVIRVPAGAKCAAPMAKARAHIGKTACARLRSRRGRRSSTVSCKITDVTPRTRARLSSRKKRSPSTR